MASVRDLPAVLKNSPALLAASALANVYVTSVLLGLRPNESWVVVPLVAVAVYSLDDLSDRIEEGKEGVSTRTAAVGAVAVVAYAVAIALATTGGPVAVALALLPGVAGVAYTLPVLPFQSVDRVKEVFLLNTAVIAVSISVPGTLLPVVFAGDPLLAIPIVALVVFWFVRYAIGVETCNVADVVEDERSGVATVPGRYGTVTTRQVLYAGDLLAFLVLVVFLPPVSGWYPVLLVLPLLPVSVFLTHHLRYPSRQEAICAAWDGLHVVLGVVVAVGVNAPVLRGLA